MLYMSNKNNRKEKIKMTLVKFAPEKELANINKRFMKFFEDFDAPFFGDWGLKSFNTNVFTPRVDVTENNENLFIHAEIPGASKEDVKVSVNGDVLTISGEKKTEKRDENKNYYRIERAQGSFSRSFTLPTEIVVEKINAEFKEGVLYITLPKTEKAKIVEKQVEIK